MFDESLLVCKSNTRSSDKYIGKVQFYRNTNAAKNKKQFFFLSAATSYGTFYSPRVRKRQLFLNMFLESIESARHDMLFSPQESRRYLTFLLTSKITS